MTITIYHNARCSNSRGALAILQEAGVTPVVIDYLKTPPDRATLLRLLADSGLAPRALMRTQEPIYAELGLAQADDAALVEAMLAHPVLINRPLVVSPKGTRLCRPPETVRELL